MSSNFVFWGKNWSWAGLSGGELKVRPYEYSVGATSHLLNFVLTGRIRKASDQQFVWDLIWRLAHNNGRRRRRYGLQT